MKICIKCNEIKELSEYFFRKDSNKYREKCKLCMIYENKIYRRNNPEITKAINGKWENNNKAQVKVVKSLYRKTHRAECNYACMKYQATKLNATVPGFDEEIKAIYKEAKELEELDGVKRHVHHIVPLQEFGHLGVFGLHIPSNLEILTEEEHREVHRRLKEEYIKITL